MWSAGRIPWRMMKVKHETELHRFATSQSLLPDIVWAGSCVFQHRFLRCPFDALHECVCHIVMNSSDQHRSGMLIPRTDPDMWISRCQDSDLKARLGFAGGSAACLPLILCEIAAQRLVEALVVVLECRESTCAVCVR